MEYNPNLTVAYLAGVADKLVKDQGRDTIMHNVSNDENARYARIPDGNACDFCKMLGSRGFVYGSEKKASTSKSTGDAYHKKCNCQIAVSFEPFMEDYWVNGVHVRRGYADDAQLVVPGRDGSYELRNVDIDKLFKEYKTAGNRYTKRSVYKDYMLMPDFMKDPLEYLRTAETEEELRERADEVLKAYKENFTDKQLEKVLPSAQSAAQNRLNELRSSNNAQSGISTVQIVGVSNGEPMNFDDADGMKANPGYESDFARVMNCQTCVVANEARRRGYEVQAQPYSKQNEAMFALAEQPTRAYINPETGKEPEMIRVEESPTRARFNKLCEETVKDGERYHLRIETKAGSGHVVCMDRDESGVLRVYDPQDGSIYKASEYLKRAKYSSKSYGITVPEDNYIFRVDNAEFNIELINGALEPAQ